MPPRAVVSSDSEPAEPVRRLPAAVSSSGSDSGGGGSESCDSNRVVRQAGIA